MKKVLILALFVALTSLTALAQDGDYKKVEFFGGFSHNRVDLNLDTDADEQDFAGELNERWGFNGFNAAITGNVNRYVGLKFDVSAHWNSEDIAFEDDLGNDRTANLDNQLWNFLGGVQIKDNASTSAIKPFAHALVGAGHISVDSTETTVGRTFVDDLGDTDETGFAAAIGGGLDVRAGDRLDIRVIQVDWNPTRFNDQTYHNFRFGFGLVFH
jgi:opacity protein-like surface antigen